MGNEGLPRAGLPRASVSGPAPSALLFASCVVGLGLYWAWTFFSFNQPMAPALPVFVLHVASMAGASVSFLLIALSWRRLSPLCMRRGVLLACGVVTTLTTPLYLLVGIPHAVAIAGAVVSGFAVAALVCALAEAFCRLPASGLLSGTSLVFLIAYALMLALTLLVDAVPRAAVVALVSALPTVSAIVLALLPRDGCAGSAASEATGERVVAGGGVASLPALLRSLPWRTFVIIACMYFAIGGMRLYVEQVTGGLTMGMGCLAAGIVLLALVAATTQYAGRHRPTASLGMFYKVALPLVIVGYVVLLAADQQATGLLSVIAQMVCLVTECLCWVLIVESARGRGVPALVVIGVGRFVVQLGMSLGEVAGLASLDNLLPFGIVTVFLLVLAFVFLFSERETSVRLGPAPAGSGSAGGAWGEGAASPVGQELALSERGAASVPAGFGGGAPSGEGHVSGAAREGGAADAVAAPADAGVACAAQVAHTARGGRPSASDAWGLTDREQAVLDLWVTSHGLRSIAGTLNVSESTVKTHVRHIYEKSGVHSRAELIALLDDLGSAGA